MKKIKIVFIVLLLLGSFTSFSQSVVPNLKRVGINTSNPLATLHVEGDLRIRKTPLFTSNFTPLVINEHGEVGTYNGVIVNSFYAQSKTRTVFTNADKTAVNTQGYIVPWSNADIVYNPGLLSLDGDNKTFSVTKKGTFELSGMVSYNPQGNNTQNKIGMNVYIKYLPKGSTTWITIAGTRYFLLPPFNAIAGTINIAPAMHNMDVGDKIRLEIITQGYAHGATGLPAIEGDDFTKMLKVMFL